MVASFSFSLTSVLAKIWMMPLCSPRRAHWAGALRGPLEASSRALAVASAEALASGLGWPRPLLWAPAPRQQSIQLPLCKRAFCSFFPRQRGRCCYPYFRSRYSAQGQPELRYPSAPAFLSSEVSSASWVSSEVFSLAGVWALVFFLPVLLSGLEAISGAIAADDLDLLIFADA